MEKKSFSQARAKGPTHDGCEKTLPEYLSESQDTVEHVIHTYLDQLSSFFARPESRFEVMVVLK
jgi:hypothetical protein